MWLGVSSPSTCCTPSRRRRKRLRGAISRSPESDSRNYREVGNEEIGELRQRLGCPCGHTWAGSQPAGSGRVDAADRSLREEEGMDADRGGATLWGDPAADQRSAPRPGLAVLTRCVGEHLYRA